MPLVTTRGQQQNRKEKKWHNREDRKIGMCFVITRTFLTFPCSFESQPQAGKKQLFTTNKCAGQDKREKKKNICMSQMWVGGSENRCLQHSKNTQVVKGVSAETTVTHQGSHGDSGIICICCPTWCLWISRRIKKNSNTQAGCSCAANNLWLHETHKLKLGLQQSCCFYI